MEKKKIIVDFQDMTQNFSDEQIREVVFFVKKGGAVLMPNFDPIDPLGRFFLSLKSSRLLTHQLALNFLIEDHKDQFRHFQGEIYYVASQTSGLTAEAMKTSFAKAGISQDHIFPLAYSNEKSGTLGVGLQDLKAGLLKNQLPDYIGLDSKGRYVIDPSATLLWRHRYEKELAFARYRDQMMSAAA